MKCKKRYVAALVLLILGLGLALAGMTTADFQIDNLTVGGALQERQYAAKGEVRALVVRDEDAPVQIVPSADGALRVSYWENACMTYDILEEDGALRVEKRREMPKLWGMDFGYTRSKALRIEVPDGVEVDVCTSNAQILLGDDEGDESVYFPSASLTTSNGAITLAGVRAGQVEAHTSNDAVQLTRVEADAISAETSNGFVSLADVRAGQICLLSSNDGMRLEGVEADCVNAKTSNGAVEFAALRVEKALDLQSSNGDIRGSLPGNRDDYRVESGTSNGENTLPSSPGGEGPVLRLFTTNGDIDISFQA